MTISSQKFSAGSGARLVATFTSSGSWTVPAGVTKYYVDIQGGGGGNGGYAETDFNNLYAYQGGGSGARGGSAAGWQLCSPGAVITITVGAGGSNGTSSSQSFYNTTGSSGNAGGTTTVGLISATGGTGGAGGYVYYTYGVRNNAPSGTPGTGSVPSSTLPGLRPPVGATYGLSELATGTGDGASINSSGIVYLYIPL